jgi:tetratricopeptide (TPR) repeat protein
VHRALEPAIEVFTKGNNLFPHSIRMLVGLGVALYARGSYDQAAERLCQASDLDPADPSPYLVMGKMQSIESTQPDAIVERLARFARLQPDNALANYYYASSLWKRRSGPQDAATIAQVVPLLQKAIHIDPRLGEAYLLLGILYADQNDLPKAISTYQAAIAVTPSLAQAHYRLAQAYRKTGESSKAKEELQLYEQASKKTAEDTERERREIQQFVYTLQSPSPASKPQ